MADKGNLKIQVNSTIGYVPVRNATISISYTGESDQVLEEVTTDQNGQTEEVALDAPPVEYSLSPSENQPYSEYNLHVTAPDYEPVTISGAQILADTNGLQNVSMVPLETASTTLDNIVIGPHTLWGDYPPKIAEDEIKPVNESGEIGTKSYRKGKCRTCDTNM